MSETIIKLQSNKEDAQLCIQDAGDILYKKISIQELLKIVSSYDTRKSNIELKPITLLHKDIIAKEENYVVIKQDGHKKIVNFKDKSYRINFPNAIYIMVFNKKKIISIYSYCYKEYRGLDTKLFEYAMPNELYGNKICLGTANLTIDDNDYVAALERVIFAEYTHTTFSGISGFTDTLRYFEYLSTNEFPYKLLKSLNKTLRTIKF